MGIDLSLTATGVVKVRGDDVVLVKLIKTKPEKGIIKELKRILSIVSGIEEEIKDVSLVAIEGLAFGIGKTSSLVQLSALNYFVRKLMMDNEKKFIIVPPTTNKKFITGKGNSKKDVVIMSIYKHYGLEFIDDNIADAFSLAKIADIMENGSNGSAVQLEIVKQIKKEQYEQ